MTSQLLSAQNGYPKQILWESDTLIAFTPKQVKLINYTKVSLDECKELSVSYRSELSLYKEASDKFSDFKKEVSKKEDYYNNIIDEQKIQLNLQDDNINKLNRNIKILKFTRIVGIGAGTFVGFYIGSHFF